MPPQPLVFDNHFHLDPRGLYLEAAKMFEKAGGTHLMLTHLPYDDLNLAVGDDYATAYARTLETADLVRAKTKITVFVAVGPYPVDLLHWDKTLGFAGGTAPRKRGVDLAAKPRRDGKG